MMRSLRIALSIALAIYMTQAGTLVFAQDTDNSPFSITLAPVQYASVKGNVGKFEALNWMPANTDYGGGVDDISFIKDINKNISVDLDGDFHPAVNDNDAELTVKDADLAFLKINYKAFRKYYDGTGGVMLDGTSITNANQGVQPKSPALQMDISYFKVEAGLGDISDPSLDAIYEHDAKLGNKSLEQWQSDYAGTGTSSTGAYKIGPAWESVNDTVDRVTLNEKKDIAGITIKANQLAEVDYNDQKTYMPYVNDNLASGGTNIPSEETTQEERIDSVLFGSGLRLEKWFNNDKTFAGLGYHYNHSHGTDNMQNQTFDTLTGLLSSGSGQTLWNFEHSLEDEHVWTGNINSQLTKNIGLLVDGKYEHTGETASSTMYELSSNYSVVQSTDTQRSNNDQDNVGEHVALHYTGIAHTELYAESQMEQDRGQTQEYYNSTHSATSDFYLDRLDRVQNNSWTVGGRIVPNRFFIFTTQVKQFWNNNNYDTLNAWIPGNQVFLDSLKEQGVEEASTLTWKPYRWLQNTFRYQLDDTLYEPLQAQLSNSGPYNVADNHMLSSTFTYDITVQPIDALLLNLTYSHVENFIRTVGATSTTTNIPNFNSGDNSFAFSTSYMPTENVVWTNTACYTISNNYVDFSTGIPLGSNFKMVNFSTGVDYTFHKWLKFGPKYEYAAYKDDNLFGQGNYSANIFLFTVGADW